MALLYDLNLADDLEPIELTRLDPNVLLPADHPLVAKDRIEAADLVGLPMVQRG